MRVALIGNGYWGSKIVNYIPSFFELSHVADSKFDKELIWKDRSVVGVIIATPIETHYELARKALENGKHVFIEKPITVDVKQALELKEMAEEFGLKIGVEYTQTFSPSIRKAVDVINDVGKLRFIEMSTKHLGRFMNFDVYWLLASHHLSILSMFLPLHRLCYSFPESVTDFSCNPFKCTTGSIFFEPVLDKNRGLATMFNGGRIDVSLNFPGKEMQATFYGESGTLKYNPMNNPSLQLTKYDKKAKALPDELTTKVEEWNFDEMNNLKFSVKYFRDLIEGKAESNLDVAIEITKILCSR